MRSLIDRSNLVVVTHLAAGDGAQHLAGGRGDLGRQGQNVDEDILVDVAVHALARGVAAVVARVLLRQVHDRDRVGGDRPPRVRVRQLDGLAVVHPLDLKYFLLCKLFFCDINIFESCRHLLYKLF